MTQHLDEAPSLRDTIGAKARAFGQRLGNAAVATAGSYVGGGDKAHGRLAVRVTADRLMQGWRRFEGGSELPPTAPNVYQFLTRYYHNVIDDATLRQITGVSADAPAAAPLTVAPVAPPTQAAPVNPIDPAQAPSEPPAAAQAEPPASSTPKTTSRLAATMLHQIASQVSQPQTDPRQVLLSIESALKQTTPGSVERQEIVALIKRFQRNNTMKSKVPQIMQIAVEGRRSSNRLALREEPDPRQGELFPLTPPAPPPVLSHSQLDKIFMQVAQQLFIRQIQSGQPAAGQDHS